jgi:hypothetical protein
MSKFLSAAALLAFAALPAAGQSSRPKVPPPISAQEKQLIGTWEGPYASEQAPPGGLRLVIARDSVWKVTLEVLSDQAIAAGEIRDLKVEGSSLSWVQDIADMLCRASGAIVDGTLKGDTSCEQGGAVTITASWVLLKK